jgi:hypothetical protein
MVSKVPCTNIKSQFESVARILNYAEARGVACSARLAELTARKVSHEYATIWDWSRNLSGCFSVAGVLADFSVGRVLSLFARADAVQLTIEPECERPFYNWDGQWGRLFRLVLVSPREAIAIGVIDYFGLEHRVNVHHSEVHDDGRVFAMRSVKGITSDQVAFIVGGLLGKGAIGIVMEGEVCFYGGIASLPGFGGASPFTDAPKMQSDILFGEVARRLKALNAPTVDWAREFYSNLESVSVGCAFALNLEREYLSWKTRDGGLSRGSSGNALRLRASGGVSELCVEFEQLSDDDPKASELKSVFIKSLAA